MEGAGLTVWRLGLKRSEDHCEMQAIHRRASTLHSLVTSENMISWWEYLGLRPQRHKEVVCKPLRLAGASGLRPHRSSLFCPAHSQSCGFKKSKGTVKADEILFRGLSSHSCNDTLTS